MSIEDEIKESLEKKDVDKFREIITRPKIYINDLFGNGILHYILVDHKDTPIEFIQVLLEQEPLNLNKVHSESRVPPLLCTDREDIQDVILGNVKCNVNKVVNEKNMMCWALENNKLGLLKKLIDHPQIDLLGENDTDEEKIAVTQSMANPEIFKLFLESPKMNVDALGWNGMIIPLDYTIQKRWIDSTLLLLEKGADMNVTSRTSLTGDYELSMAERIILLGHPVLIKFVLDKLDRVKHTSRLLLLAIMQKKRSFTYSSMEQDIDLIGTLIKKKCLLNERFILEAFGSIYILNTIIDHVDEEINLKNGEILIKGVFLSENIELINKFLGTQFAIKHKAFILELLDKIINPLVINSILSIDELVKEHVLVIFTRSSYGMFVTLLKMGEPGIERINHLLDISSVKLPLMFPPLGLLIKTGTEPTINLAKKLLENHGVIPQSVKEMDYFIENKRMDILEFLIRKEIRLNVFGKTLTINSFMELVKLLGDNTELRDMLITKTILTDKGKDIVIHSIKQFIDFEDETSELLLLIVRGFGVELDDMLFREPFDGSKNLLFELLEGLPSEKYINELIDIIKTSQLPNLVNRIRDLNLLYRFIELGDIDLIRLLMRNSDLVASINVKDLIEIYGSYFMYEHLREICERFEPDKINLQGAIPIVLSVDSDAIFSNDVLGTIVRHPRFNPNEIYEDEHGIMNTQLQLLLKSIETAQTQQMVEYVISIFQVVLQNPQTDPNQLNGPVNHDTTQTVLDTLLLLDYIDDYEEKEYQSDQPFHMILKMILKHPRLNMTPHYHFHRVVCSKRLGELFTQMISIANFDIDAAFLLHIICSEGNDVFLSILLTLQTFDINYSAGEETPLHLCIAYEQEDCARMLIEDPRIDLSVLDKNGKNYAELAREKNIFEIVESLRARGVIDDRAERMAQEEAEYDARMAAIGRPKHGRLKDLLDIYDDILQERENPDSWVQDSHITLFSKSLCPFCLVSLEKENPYECVYLSGHTCHPDVRNETLMAKYLGPEWATKHFEVCCTCGRPGNNHGHYRIVPDGETSSLAAPGALVNHWRCDQYNGGGGKEEMVTRLVGILSYLKVRVDSEEHLEDNAELSRQLALEADKALFDQTMKDRAGLIFENRAWNANSTIAPYKRFNAPRAPAAATARVEEVLEPIVYLDNRLKPEGEKDNCGLCLEERDDLYKPHESDSTYICGVCLYKTVCIVPYRSVTCGSGCIPKKQIHKADVEALMDGQLCQLMAPIAAAEAAQAAQERRNYNARRAGRNNRNDELEEGEIRD